MKLAICCVFLGLVLFFVWLPSFATPHEIEHPGILHRDDKCLSCHIDKTQGKSVHSAMLLPCTDCHISQTHGDMTTMHLSLSRQMICLDCHDRSMVLRQHRPAVKGSCLDCHDAHSSRRPMLLRPVYHLGLRNPLLFHAHNKSYHAISKRMHTEAP